jgi:hypothetical protein
MNGHSARGYGASNRSAPKEIAALELIDDDSDFRTNLEIHRELKISAPPNELSLIAAFASCFKPKSILVSCSRHVVNSTRDPSWRRIVALPDNWF